MSAGGGLAPRHFLLSLCLTSGRFDVNVRGCGATEPLLRLHDVAEVTTASGMPVRAWDLHIGATLCVLGKSVSLRSCDVSTGVPPARTCMLLMCGAA
jgi:hypothetical protein